MVPLVHELVEGFREGGLYVIAGPPGIGKTVFIRRTVLESLKDFTVFYVSADTSVKDFIDFLDEYGLSQYRNRIIIIDGFSTGATGIKKDTSIERIDFSKSSDAIYKLYSKLNSVPGDKLLIIDSLTEFFIGTEPSVSITFIKGLKEVLENTSSVGIATVHTGLEDLSGIYWTLEYLVDGYIELSYEPNFESLGFLVRRIRIKKMRSSHHEANWIPYKILENYKLEFMTAQELKAIAEALVGKRQS